MGQGEFLCGLVGSKAGGISVLKVFTPDRAGATAVRWPEDASYRSRAPSPGGPDSCGGGGVVRQPYLGPHKAGATPSAVGDFFRMLTLTPPFADLSPVISVEASFSDSSG